MPFSHEECSECSDVKATNPNGPTSEKMEELRREEATRWGPKCVFAAAFGVFDKNSIRQMKWMIYFVMVLSLRCNLFTLQTAQHFASPKNRSRCLNVSPQNSTESALELQQLQQEALKWCETNGVLNAIYSIRQTTTEKCAICCLTQRSL